MNISRILKQNVITLILISIPTSLSLAQGMSVERVLDNMREAYEKSIRNIDDYTVESDLYTAYHKKTIVDGKPVFKIRTDVKGLIPGMGSSTSVGHDNIFNTEMYEQLRTRAEYKGTEQVNGVRTHVLFAPELKSPGQEDEPAPPMKNVRMYIDADLWVLRQMTADMEVDADKGTQTIQPVFVFDDYRNFDGLLIPFITRMEMGDMDDSVSPEDREKARQGMKDLEKQMAEMPEAQRKMMEGMLKPQIERLQKMLAGDKIEFVITVEEVKVNTGLSDELFK
jgi:hypothetical protein